MTTTSYRVRRPLTDPEMTTIRAAADAATSPPEILIAAVTTVFTALLEPLGETLADYGPARPLVPGAFAIPLVQWEYISEAALARADAFGGRMLLVMELIDRMPASYDDPTVTAAAAPVADQRPYEHVLTVSREAVDAIAAASRRCGELARYFGEDSRQHREALWSWETHLSRLFGMAFGAATSISRDGELSLLVSTQPGIVYGIIFHAERRHCTTGGCHAVINDDGVAWTYLPGDRVCADGQHVLSYPLDAPAPGTWSFHS
jgi:hypothetical protein